MESRFRYQVTPYSPIKDLIPGQSLRRPFTSDLTKEEVLLCMKHGPVSRLFPGKLPIKVTGSNLDSLHRKQFEGDFIDITSKYTGEAKKAVIEHPEVASEPKTEVPTEEKSVENTESTESVVEEPEVKEERIEESTPAADDEQEALEETGSVEAEESHEESEDEEGETLSVEDVNTPVSVPNQQNQYYNKKKKRH